MQKIFPWFFRMDLHDRLFVIFSVLFLFAALILGNFLNMSGKVIGYNIDARQSYESARQTYQLQALLLKLELAHYTYLADEDFNALGDFTAYSRQMQDEIASIKAEVEADLENFDLLEEEAAPTLTVLDELEVQRQQYTDLLSQIQLAIESEDYDSAYQYDDKTGVVLEAMYDRIDVLNVQKNDELTTIQEDVDWFSSMGYLSILIVLPIFLLIVVFAVVIIHFQINIPMERLLHATRSLHEGKVQAERLNDLGSRQDEIGLLANEFNAMALAVTHRMEDLRIEADSIRAKIR